MSGSFFPSSAIAGTQIARLRVERKHVLVLLWLACKPMRWMTSPTGRLKTAPLFRKPTGQRTSDNAAKIVSLYGEVGIFWRTIQVCHAGRLAVIGNRVLSPALVLVAGSPRFFTTRLA
jgi:hypothetical protein